ncbi:MAG: dihydrofolate reductase [Porphyromonadaceae bacterium]|nr:dihydrofolate reductase [Porphyromonadaceae bacterium]
MTTKENIEIGIIVALDENNGIGREGNLLCHLPNDLKHFKEVTSGHTVIMGRRTYESLPKGALPNRTNVVVTSNAAENYPGCIVVRSVEEALTRCKESEKIFIMGGGQLYRATFGLADRLYLTRIHHTFSDADTFFPEIDFDEWTLTEKEIHDADNKHRYPYTFLTYRKK